MKGSEWSTVAELFEADDSPARVQDEGTVGFTSDDLAPFVLESFTRTAL